MRTWKQLSLLTTIAAALCVPAPASAAFQHVVAPGETLSSVAAADGLPVSQLAAANGLSLATELTAGSSLAIPAQDAAGAAATSSATTSGSDADADGDDSGAAESGAAAPSAATPSLATSGGYIVQPGDTLSALAARYGVSMSALAADNNIDPAGLLVSGTTIDVSGLSAATAAPSAAPAAGPDQSGGAQPTQETVSASQVGSIAAQNGVSPALAEAIGYQESGFNNNEVSSTGATGVMQIEPGTWNYIGQNLATPPPLSASSAADNIRGGVLLLHSLLNQTGGDQAMAAAAYYQGLQSVRAHGLFADTQRYVNDVTALAQRFGGG
ncbi:MAG TPA: LysM peptidoglycan-binding domain-containing protein [Solirubrobacteraceae bacterium]